MSGDPPPVPPVTAVVFDLGGVLLDWNPRYLYRKLFDDDRELERFLSEICTLEWHAAHDRGVPVARSCAELAAAHPDHAELIHAWGERSEEMIGGPIEETVAILARLRARGVPCYALTNMEAETYPLRLARFEFLHWFDGTVVSAEERVAKPDPEIFRRLLSRFELTPERTVFVDDAEVNIAAARERGMQTVLFRSAGRLRSWLVQAGLLPAHLFPSDTHRHLDT
jgi:2-haloacid dehalogenase